MRKKDGSFYKESVVKTMWNVTAKLERKNIVKISAMDPFNDVRFKSARGARDAARKILQMNPEKRKESSSAFTYKVLQILKLYDENKPGGLQKKIFHPISYELAFRGGEAANCLTDFFQEEKFNDRTSTNRIEYNIVFSKTCQGATDNKWLIRNTTNEDICPVRLYKKLLSKRGSNVKTNRLFLTPNREWQNNNIWFKNIPVGRNEIAKWTKLSVQKAGLDSVKFKFTNHSHRATAVNHLAKVGVNENQLTKLTGHGNVSSIKPYLQLDKEFHEEIIRKMRNSENNEFSVSSVSTSASSNVVSDQQQASTGSIINFNNCVFNCKNFNN
ncbi:uncharacterized protein LOC123306411 [Coccinella septempunctata]|uniref:uncharacterized protein LOC123306411 n=1 Tax=Coccinella septempunctata TaxID=41139 RepID=UPI001D082480|nr:uncharacterized protein LOC123306411 [Coccinella septempunctata]